MATICKGITQSGINCKRKVIGGSYCYQHKEKTESKVVKAEVKKVEKVKTVVKKAESKKEKEGKKKEEGKGRKVERGKREKVEKSKVVYEKTVINKNEKKECSICLEDIEMGQFKVDGCGHTFHMNCMKGMRNKDCPMCRRKITNLPLVIEREIDVRMSKDKTESEAIANWDAIVSLLISHR